MTEEIICCGEVCDPTCACSTAQECDSDQCCYEAGQTAAPTLITIE